MQDIHPLSLSPRLSFSFSSTLFAALFTGLFFLSACDRTPPPSDTIPEAKLTDQPTPPPSPPEPPPQNLEELSAQVEALTGAHTRVVWAHHVGTGGADPFATGRSHELHGLDTRDGLGARVLIAKKSNYSRPLISPDGTRIVYTLKDVQRRDDGIKKFDLKIFTTDWSGAEPVELAPGYALSLWPDPATGQVWVYAARDVPPTHRVSWAAKRLVRFLLDDPATEELLWDKTLISPDNIQLSADGRRASGQAPWPHGGQFVFEVGQSDFRPTEMGCWAGMAPDNSYISWMLDGNHRQATLFVAAPEEKRWVLPFNAIPGLEKGEIYHPRWSNHPRFVALTGPYLAERSADGQSAISKGGRTAEVVIAKLNETLTGFEDRVFLTKNKAVDTYPDLWIAGGREQVLAGFAQGAAVQSTAPTWPSNSDSLAYLWEQIGSANTIRPADGSHLDGSVEPMGTALFGSRRDMLLSHDSFAPSAILQKHLQSTLPGAEDWTLQATLLPHPVLNSDSASGTLLTLPGWHIGLNDNRLQINGTPIEHPPLEYHVHLALVRQAGAITLFINGQPMAPVPIGADSAHADTRFGGDGLPLGLLGVALHLTALPVEDIQAASTHWLQTVGLRLANPPPRVRLRAKLTETTPPPTPDSLDAYTRAMIANLYQVEEVLEGEYAETEVLALHWVVMDSKPLSDYPNTVGQVYELTLESFDVERHHPELKGQRLFGEDLSLQLDLWYDVLPPTR